MTLRFPFSAPILTAALLAGAAQGDGHAPDWLTMSDAEFAAAYADTAFGASLEDRQKLAWMFFVRVNQQIAGGMRVDIETGTVPLWMAWPTDPETFNDDPGFEFTETPRDDPQFVTPKDVLAGEISVTSAEGAPNSGNEETTRNQLGYDYIVNHSKTNTYDGVLAYVRAGNQVDLPVGAIETKMKWIEVTDEKPAPGGAMVFAFTDADGRQVQYWWGGMHIMAKMRPAPQGTGVFYDETPSWFWTTFEFNGNPGVDHVRAEFITQRAPLTTAEIDALLAEGGIDGIGYKNYSPNGTQIRFTVDGDGADPVRLGHTMMEDFAGHPDPNDPAGWTSFDASCHTCHSTAAVNPDTGEYFPFTVPTGALSPDYSTKAKSPITCEETTYVLGDGFMPLDFMWPYPFQAPYDSTCPKDDSGN